MFNILYAWAVTSAFETPFFFLLKSRNMKSLLAMVLLNTISNILMNVLYIEVFDYAGFFVPAAEFYVFFLESLFLYRLDKRNPLAFLWGILANSSSYLAGKVINIPIQSNYSLLPYIAVIMLFVAVIEIMAFIAIIFANKTSKDK